MTDDRYINFKEDQHYNKIKTLSLATRTDDLSCIKLVSVINFRMTFSP